jgi:hypothetical protein
LRRLFNFPLASFLAPLLFVVPVSAGLVSAIADYDGENAANLPPRLSLTGLYDNVASPSRAVTSGIVAYEVNSALWSDGAHKERFIVLPAGQKAVPTDSADYAFPNKTVFVKNFLVDSVHGDSSTRFLAETRFLIVRQGSFPPIIGISYKWRRNQTEADLVSPLGGLDTLHAVRWKGTIHGKRWRYPSSGDCNTCHRGRGVLGFITPQLNRPSRANPSINQLQAFVTANVLTFQPSTAFRWAALTEQNATPPAGLSMTEWRVRSYFASNCSHCHGNGVVWPGADHDFDFFTVRSIAGDTQGGYLGKVTNRTEGYPRLIYPDYPDSSYILKRMVSRGTLESGEPDQMPPLATFQMDSTAALTIRDWVCAMGSRTACALPVSQTDSSYWAPSGIHGHGRAARAQNSLIPRLRGNLLLLPDATGRVQVTDNRGREIRISRLAAGVYRFETALPPGVYLVRRGTQSARFSRIE